ncbi:MAG TPA: XdhC/CoxI family protein [Candidatus Marinimicrobia bacterium]|nr:XdhC/CoxI family protein [Candidatus Neomarinimicrobiota bacterium]
MFELTSFPANSFWETAASLLEERQKVFLALVAEHTQHSPGTTGAKLLVAKECDPLGTIGGGIMEYNLVKRAEGILDRDSFTPELQTLIHRKSGPGEKSGMICAGQQTNVYYMCDPEKDSKDVNKLSRLLSENRSAKLSIDPSGMVVQEQPPNLNQNQIKLSVGDENWLYEEQLFNFNRIAIIGGGHCSLALSRLMKQLGFNVSVFDTRENVSTIKENTYANTVQIVDDFCGSAALIEFSELTFVVVMTTDVVSDVRGVLGAIDLPFPFIGVMGSQSKIAEIVKQLTKEGITKDQLKRLTAPVGIPMVSNTPEEIAVSVAAQILQYKNSTS